MSSILVKVSSLSRKYPMMRGMAAYCAIWPISSLCQQTIVGKEKFDYVQALRFSIYGGCFVAPTLFMWLKLSSAMWPTMTFKSAITKALVEQVSYGPGAMVSFFFGMSLMEGKTIHEASSEVRAKFFPTYQVGVCVWPVLQTINFMVVPERNRMLYVSICSLLWTSFLAYMKQLEVERVLKQSQLSII